jgi:hypothetical protein
MALPVRVHDPDAVLDYPCDLKKKGWLPPGDALVTATVVGAPGVIVDRVDLDTDNGVIIPWIRLDPAVVAPKYKVTYHWVTAAGREDDRSVELKRQER